MMCPVQLLVITRCRFNVIPILADILSDSVKEKVTRIILAVFRVSHETLRNEQTRRHHFVAHLPLFLVGRT